MAVQSKNKKDRSASPIANVKVIGIGGGGGNAISRMSRDFTRGVEFIAINTDSQDLDHCDAKQRIYIGRNLTRGLGTGMNPDIGRQAAEENRSEIAEAVRGADLIFLTAGLGGGTGTGATPVVAEVAKQSGALTVAVVTKPFAFEGGQRERIAQEGIVKLKDKVDALVVVPNDRVFTLISKETPILKAFEVIDDVLRNSLKGIVELIVTPGIINVDFADVKNIVQDAGPAIVGVGLGIGQDRAVNAVNAALNSPLLETTAEGAKAILLGISGGRDLRMTEINDAAKIVAQIADPGARIIFGAYYDKNLKQNQIKVTLIATGFNGNQAGSLFAGHGNGHLGSHLSDDRSGMMLGSKATSFRPAQKSEELPSMKREISDPGERRPNEELDFKPLPAKKEDKFTDKKKDADAWDVPAFLRRKRK